jgi:predicted nucleotidyltransferase
MHERLVKAYRTNRTRGRASRVIGRSRVNGQAGDDGVLTRIVRCLIEAYRPELIYLFGSSARGDAGPDSDYDLLIIVPDSASAHRRASRLAYDVLWDIGKAADILVCTRRHFESRLHLSASLPATVVREGKLLYVA